MIDNHYMTGIIYKNTGYRPNTLLLGGKCRNIVKGSYYCKTHMPRTEDKELEYSMFGMNFIDDVDDKSYIAVGYFNTEEELLY